MIRINFQAYNANQLVEIVNSRLATAKTGLPANTQDVVAPDGIMFAAKKVSNISGDARRVLIIGAGPAGVMCANALARAGVDVRIVDKRCAARSGSHAAFALTGGQGRVGVGGPGGRHPAAHYRGLPGKSVAVEHG